MVAYTVYPFNASGVAPLFILIDQEDDAGAAAAAINLLKGYRSADRVSVWCEDRIVFSGPSTDCAIWLAGEPERRAACPAQNSSEQPCPPDCGRLSGPRPIES